MNGFEAASGRFARPIGVGGSPCTLVVNHGRWRQQHTLARPRMLLCVQELETQLHLLSDLADLNQTAVRARAL